MRRSLRLVRYNSSGIGKDAHMSENGASESRTSFEALYRSLLRPAIDEIAQQDVADGADPAERASEYTERGKPDFTLAYLLISDMPDEENARCMHRPTSVARRTSSRRRASSTASFTVPSRCSFRRRRKIARSPAGYAPDNPSRRARAGSFP